jgi:2-succinyl-5-enolpyruvyl-6-hydroxy-3-cyclohexene-1-carboxylate synthase
VSEPDRGDVAFACASALVAELVRGGMRQACCSPGSRSTALALALARRPEIELHVHLDERASAFFALGAAKATRRPVAVACTSGTAAAELYPAVVEAAQSRTPLVLLTADRPPRLRGTGANQTIDQVDLFGAYARTYVEPPVPRTAAEVPEWSRAGETAALAAMYGTAVGDDGSTSAGPVHVNCPFDEPLAPPGPVRAPPAIGAPIPAAPPPVRTVSPELVELVAGVERGLVVVGSQPDGDRSVLDLAQRLGWPVLAEPTSHLRVPDRALRTGQVLAGSSPWMADHAPDVVLQFGAAPTTRAVQHLVGAAAALAVIDDHHLDPDPEGRAVLRLRRHPSQVLPGVTDDVPPATRTEWLNAWRRADLVAGRTMDEVLDSWEEPFEGRIARDLAGGIPDGSTLFVGSSMPIRDLDTFMRPRKGLRVLANRGASGIDGLVSTAMGVAAAQPKRTTYALLGDLSFLYDLGSLAWSGRRPLDLVVVVANNDGGAIFSFLPVRDLPEHERLFTTPHGLDLGALCGAAGVLHTRMARAGDLVESLAQARGGGVRVMEAVVDRDLNVRRHADVQAAIDDALRGAAGA